jgi:hypothetical protein
MWIGRKSFVGMTKSLVGASFFWDAKEKDNAETQRALRGAEMLWQDASEACG